MAKISKKNIENAKKFLEYRNNPVAFMEECVKIPTPGGSQLIKLYKPQKRVVKGFFKYHDLILLKSRQIGMSTIAQALIVYLVTFYENCIVGLVSRDNAEASDFCRKVKDMLSQLPDWLRPKYKNDQLQYFVLENGSAFFSSTIPSTNPGSVFRGKAITLLIVDEAAFLRNVDVAWTSMSQTVNKSQLTAKKTGIPFGNVIISTPNKIEGIGKWFARTYQLAKEGGNSFVPFEIHWKEIPEFKNDPSWYKRQCDLLNNDKRRILQELELKFIGSDSTLFNEIVQEALQNIKPKPKEMKLKWGGVLEIYQEKNQNKFYIIGVDCASSAGEDFSTVQVMDFETMEQVMEYKGKLEPIHFAEVVKMIAKLVPHNIIVVENTGGFGLTVINELQFDTNTAFNIFGEYRGKGNDKKFIYGLSTNGKSRPLILEAMFDYVNSDTQTIKSRRLAMELLALTNKSDKIQADSGFNDDLAMAWGFCCYVRKYCPERLGNVNRIEVPEERETLPVEDSMYYVSSMNEDTTTIGLSSKGIEDFGQLKKNLDRYIKDNLGKMGGEVDILSLLERR